MISKLRDKWFKESHFFTEKKWKKEEYNKYTFSWKEAIEYFAKGVFIILVISKLFYDTYLVMMFLSPLLLLYFKIVKQSLIKQRKRELSIQFKETILSISASLHAGYSMENAFRQGYKDINTIYGKQSMISKELYWIIRNLDNNCLLEDQLYDLGKRSNIDEIKEFAEIIMIAKKSGGNINQIIQNCVCSIMDKIEIKREIDTVVSGKKMESKIMSGVPLFIIGYISITSPGFFTVLYHNLAGIIIMTMCLLIYCLAFYLSQKILNREYL